MTSSPWHRLQIATKFVKHPTAHCRTSQQDQHSAIRFFLCGDAVQPKCEFISTKMDPTADIHYSSATVSPSFFCRSSGTSGQIHICLSLNKTISIGEEDTLYLHLSSLINQTTVHTSIRKGSTSQLQSTSTTKVNALLLRITARPGVLQRGLRYKFKKYQH